MSKDPREAALRGASKVGVPYVHKSGRTVTVVYAVRVAPDDRISGDAHSAKFASAGLAANVATAVYELLASGYAGSNALQIALRRVQRAREAAT